MFVTCNENAKKELPSVPLKILTFENIEDVTALPSRFIPELNIPRPVSFPLVEITPFAEIAIPEPSVKAVLALVVVKYRLAEVSITLAVVSKGVTAVTTLALVKYRLLLVSITLAVVSKGVTAATTLVFV
jgi:hypothetical protein